jgi:hypothetical protein
MKLKLDENLGQRIAELFRQYGHEGWPQSLGSSSPPPRIKGLLRLVSTRGGA